MNKPKAHTAITRAAVAPGPMGDTNQATRGASKLQQTRLLVRKNFVRLRRIPE